MGGRAAGGRGGELKTFLSRQLLVEFNTVPHNTMSHFFRQLAVFLLLVTSAISLYVAREKVFVLLRPGEALATTIDVLSGENQRRAQGELNDFLTRKISSELRRAEMEKLLPSEFQRTEVFEKLERLAEDSGVTISEISFGEKPEARGDWQELGFSLTVRGGKNGLLGFLAGTENPGFQPLLLREEFALERERGSELLSFLPSVGGSRDRWELSLRGLIFAAG